MGKLVPYWGESPQPGSMYYYQKLNHDVFGIVIMLPINQLCIYLTKELILRTLTIHCHILPVISQVYLILCVVCIKLFLDNASSTNKNCFTMAWAWEMVQQGKLDFIRISFMIPDHTKFVPDQLFSKIAKTYYKRDMFTAVELQNVVLQYADVVVDDGNIVSDWRTKLSKYSKFPGIRSLYDFLFLKNSVTGKVFSKVRKQCYSGKYTNSTIHLLEGRVFEENVLCNQDDTYQNISN